MGQGLANLASPLFGGIPATAAIARTAVNIRSGAGSRLAAVTHAAFLLLVAVAATGGSPRSPLAALSGVLIATAVQMVRVSSLRALFRATRSDALVHQPSPPWRPSPSTWSPRSSIGLVVALGSSPAADRQDREPPRDPLTGTRRREPRRHRPQQ